MDTSSILSSSSDKVALNPDVPAVVEQPGCDKKVVCIYTGVIVSALLIIGFFVGIGASGGFGSTGWLQQTAIPAIKEAFEKFGHWVAHTAVPAVRDFLNKTLDLTWGQFGSYVLAPAAGALIIGTLAYKIGYEKCYAAKQVNDTLRNLDFTDVGASLDLDN